MPALDSILPMANPVSTGPGDMAMAPAGNLSMTEPFDQVMTRALSPAAADEPASRCRSDAAPTVSGGEQPKTDFAPAARRRLQARNPASETTAPIAGETGGSAVQSKDKKSNAQVSEGDDGKKGGNVTTDSSVHHEAQVTSGDLPGVTVPLVTSLPVGMFSFFKPAAENKGASDTGVGVPAASAPDTIGTLVAGREEKTNSTNSAIATASNLEASSNKKTAGLISSLKPDGSQKTGKADAAAIGEIKPSNFQPASLNADDLKKMGFSINEPADHSPQIEALPSTVLSGEAITPVPPGSNGTSAAKQYIPMKKAEKTNKVAEVTGKTEKVLPGSAGSTGQENNLPTVEPLNRIASRNGSATVMMVSSTQGREPSAASATDTALTSSNIDLRSRALERTHDMVAMQAVRLVDAKMDSLSVVIKPGAGMQLSLEMRQHGDAIDARMTLQHGDFDQLKQHWPELQQRLEQRGVRLAALTGGENSTTGNGANGFQQSQRGFSNPDPLEAGAFAEFAHASPFLTPTTPATAPVRTVHGWETWA